MADNVACGIPVRRAHAFWLRPGSSRTLRTDSPTETSIRRRAGRYPFIS
jgi:hypothetical protein